MTWVTCAVRLSSKGEEKQETHLARRRIISSSSGPTSCLAGFGCIAPRGTQAAASSSQERGLPRM